MKPISFISHVQQGIKCFGGGSQTSQSSSNSSPWSGQQPYLTNLFSGAQNQYQNYTPQYFGYSGTAGGSPVQTGPSQVVPFNTGEENAISQMGALGMNGTPALASANNTVANVANMNPYSTPGNTALNQYASGAMLGAGNPYFQSMAQEVQNNALPGMMGSFTQGATDNPNVAYAASQGMGTALGNLAGQTYNQQTQNQLNAAQQLAGNYNTNIGNMLTAAYQAPSLYNTQLSGANQALTAGETAQEQAQNELSNAVNAYNYYQQLPYMQINQFSNLIGGQYGGTTVGSQTVPQQSLFGSLFSDRRLKENIRRIGTADNGLPIYAFTYKSDSLKKTHIGFMADEVEAVHPQAVWRTTAGTMMVDYDIASLPRKEDA